MVKRLWVRYLWILIILFPFSNVFLVFFFCLFLCSSLIFFSFSKIIIFDLVFFPFDRDLNWLNELLISNVTNFIYLFISILPPLLSVHRSIDWLIDNNDIMIKLHGRHHHYHVIIWIWNVKNNHLLLDVLFGTQFSLSCLIICDGHHQKKKKLNDNDYGW